MDLQEKMNLFLNEKKIDKKEMLINLRSLKRRIEEAEAIVKADESPFDHLSMVKSNITDILRKLM